MKTPGINHVAEIYRRASNVSTLILKVFVLRAQYHLRLWNVPTFVQNLRVMKSKFFQWEYVAWVSLGVFSLHLFYQFVEIGRSFNPVLNNFLRARSISSLKCVIGRIKNGLRIFSQNDISFPEVILSGLFLTFFSLSVTNQLEAQEEKQDPKRGSNVEQRNRGEFNPRGIRAGGFLIYPKIEVEEKFNSNIYSKPNNATSDLVSIVSPSLEAKSDFNRHSLNLALKSDFGFHAKIDDENYQDISASVNSTIDVSSSLTLNLSADISRGHEQRSSPDAADGKEPTITGTKSFKVSANYKPNKASTTIDWGIVKSDFDDAVTSDGTIINNDDRDKTEYTTSLRLGYDLFPEHEAFVKAEYKIEDLNDDVDDTGLNRDSNGIRVSVGSTIDLTGLVEGEFSVGYMSQSYDDARFTNISAPFVDGSVDWHVSGLTTLSAGISRSTVGTTTPNSPGYVNNQYNFNIDHELLRNHIIGAGINYAVADYKKIDREDKTLGLNIYSETKLNRNLFARLNVSRQSRTSTLDTSEFSETIFSLKLGVQF